jgi:SAM-dependent methyltransferase
MEAYEYQTLYEFEGTYWWYRHLHAVLLQTLQHQAAGDGMRLLDAGCGTGGNLASLAGHISLQIFGFDISRQAAPFWEKRGLHTVCNASVNQIPYPAGTFDHVVCVDVLESQEVDEALAVSELIRVTRPGGTLCLVVPAYDSLMSPRHHQAVHAIRRYTPDRLLALFTGQPVQVLRSTYLFAPVFPLVAPYRWLQKLLPSDPAKPPHSELAFLPTWVNWLLFKAVSLELPLLRKGRMPFGSSILAVLEKVA